MGFNSGFKGLNEASELIKRQMAETGITSMPARLQEDEFCANSLFSIGMNEENIAWNVYRLECSRRRRRRRRKKH